MLNYNDLESFKAEIKAFMENHDLVGMQMIIPYKGEEVVFRACGKGMVHPKGTPLEGVELWESLNDCLRKGDKAKSRIA